ncbi:MAG: tyrosine-type recombinase/integrase [Bacteroidota bacterium]|nr:tyrosine-type recombinase/integrase [Bacteroidota bacterium]
MTTEKFLEYLQYERNYSSHTVLSYRKDLEQFSSFITRQCGEFSILTIDSDLIRLWIVDLMEQKNTPSTVKRKLSAIKSYFKFLIRQGVTKKNPTNGVSGPKNSKKIPIFVKEADMDVLLDHSEFGSGFEAVRNKLIIHLFYITGVRRAEILNLMDSDIDFSTQAIKVTGKRNKQRIIPFGDETHDLLIKYLEERDVRIGIGDGHVFVKEDGAKLYPMLLYRIVKNKLSETTTLSKRSPHILRHTFATSMLNHGAELNSVKELLGHSSLAATEVYTHTTFEELKKSYNAAHPRAADSKKGG